MCETGFEAMKLNLPIYKSLLVSSMRFCVLIALHIKFTISFSNKIKYYEQAMYVQ